MQMDIKYIEKNQFFFSVKNIISDKCDKCIWAVSDLEETGT